MVGGLIVATAFYQIARQVIMCEYIAERIVFGNFQRMGKQGGTVYPIAGLYVGFHH